MTDIIASDKSKEDFLNEHAHYADIMPGGIENYPFVESRINPIFYEIPDGSKVLDVGCNSGEFMMLLRDKKGCNVTGADVSDKVIELCKAKGLNVVHCDADKLPFPDASFDVITLMEVLEHFHEPVPYLQEIRRVLKPNGILLGSCPHANLERYIWDDGRLHHQYYTEQGIRDDMDQVFDMTHLQILKGKEFSVHFGKSHLGEKECEILFKAGGRDCQAWGQQGRESKDLKVWFGPTQLAGTAYYRMLGFAEKMDKAGLVQAAFERAPWDKMDDRIRGWQSRIRNKLVLNQLDRILRVADISIWQLTASRDVLSFLRCAHDLANDQWYKATGEKKFFVTDVDDNIFEIPSGNVAGGPYQPNSEAEWICKKQLEMSDALVCSTQFLVDKMRVMFPEKPIYLVPNSIDFELWDKATDPDMGFPKKEDGWLRIGYTGCSNHRKDLELLKEPLCAILKEFPKVQFLFTPQPEPEGTFMGWQGIPNMYLVQKWVDIDKYPAFVKNWDLDIGLAPLRDNEFNRAKSNLRWLEYSAMKRPTIASRVYPFKNSIIDGQDGLVCNTSQQWYDALKSLITDPSRRQAIGQNAYARVKSDFNMDRTAKRYAKILEEIRCSAQISNPKLPVSLETLPTLAGLQRSSTHA